MFGLVFGHVDLMLFVSILFALDSQRKCILWWNMLNAFSGWFCKTAVGEGPLICCISLYRLRVDTTGWCVIHDILLVRL